MNKEQLKIKKKDKKLNSCTSLPLFLLRIKRIERRRRDIPNSSLLLSFHFLPLSSKIDMREERR
jgi:hypothetical protein